MIVLIFLFFLLDFFVEKSFFIVDPDDH